jgi:peptidoglycan hydrolase-like protein with peptidoglycan-binding domain
MRGNDVKAAQATLISRGFLAAKSADGIYGPVTANAAKAAKWTLGYAAKDVTLTYGPQLDAYLRGAKKPTIAMAQRAKLRQRKPSETLGAQAADVMTAWATAFWHEAPAGSNYVPQLSALAKTLGASPYIYGMRYPWCGMGVFTAALKVGAESGKTGIRQGLWNALYTPTIQQMARDGRYGLRAVSVRNGGIAKGIGVLFDFNGGGVDHVGIALGKPGQVVFAANKKWKPKRSQIVTVEANTSLEGENGSQSDGGCVAVRIRDLSLIPTAFSIS